ncbi:MAG: hypothetical protein R3E31_08980 [Chloroflexota bacterium]
MSNYRACRMRTWLTSMALSAIMMCLLGELMIQGQQMVAKASYPIIYGAGLGRIIAIDVEAGTFTDAGALAPGMGTQAIAQSHETGYVYYLDRDEAPGDAAGVAYWDPATAQNTVISTAVLGFYPKRLDFAPDWTLYVMSDADEIGTVNPQTGAVSPLLPVTGLVTGAYQGTGDMAFAPDGTLYLVTYRNLYTVELSSRTATLLYADMIPSVPGNLSVWTGLAFCNFHLYGSAAFQDTNPDPGIYEPGIIIYEIDLGTGALTEIAGPIPATLDEVRDLASCEDPTNYTAVSLQTFSAQALTETAFWIIPALLTGFALLWRKKRQGSTHQ